MSQRRRSSSLGRHRWPVTFVREASVALRSSAWDGQGIARLGPAGHLECGPMLAAGYRVAWLHAEATPPSRSADDAQRSGSTAETVAAIGKCHYQAELSRLGAQCWRKRATCQAGASCKRRSNAPQGAGGIGQLGALTSLEGLSAGQGDGPRRDTSRRTTARSPKASRPAII